MTSSYTKNLRRIRRAVRSPRVAAFPLQLRLLAYAVAHQHPSPSACVHCHLEMPGYVDAELDHRLPALRESFTRQHLLVCANCSKDYADLLETAIRYAESRLSQSSQMPRPDLKFLEESHG
jgi:hypothetical protein